MGGQTQLVQLSHIPKAPGEEFPVLGIDGTGVRACGNDGDGLVHGHVGWRLVAFRATAVGIGDAKLQLLWECQRV